MNDTQLTAATLTGAGAFLALAGIHVTHGTFDAQLTSAVDYANDTLFTLGLLGAAAAAQLLRRHGAGARATLLATFGPLLVAAGVVAGLVLGHSPSWFAAVGVPGNLLWLTGLILVAARALRAGTLPAPLALALPLCVVCGVGMAEFGGSIVPAVVLAALAARLGRARTLGRPVIGRVA